MATPEEMAYCQYRECVDHWCTRGDKELYDKYADVAWMKAVKQCKITAQSFRYEPECKGQLSRCIFTTREERIARLYLKKYWEIYVKV
jgi:hypothetical protein